MPKFNIMVEKIHYTPFFKTFEAATQEEAEKAAQAEANALTLKQELDDLGWEIGDSSEEYELRPEVTTLAKPEVAPFADLKESAARDKALDRWRKA